MLERVELAFVALALRLGQQQLAVVDGLFDALRTQPQQACTQLGTRVGRIKVGTVAGEVDEQVPGQAGSRGIEIPCTG